MVTGCRDICGYSGANGTGGLLIVFSKSLTNSGMICSDGSNGGYGYYAGGGGSGGGSVNLFYLNSVTKGSISAGGGSGGGCNGTASMIGGYGGNGSVSIGNISTGTYTSQE